MALIFQPCLHACTVYRKCMSCPHSAVAGRGAPAIPAVQCGLWCNGDGRHEHREVCNSAQAEPSVGLRCQPVVLCRIL